MHEIKSPFLILMEEQSYLAQSLESAFEKQNVKVKIVTIAEASSIVISEKPSGYLICTGAFKEGGQRKSNGRPGDKKQDSGIYYGKHR